MVNKYLYRTMWKVNGKENNSGSLRLKLKIKENRVAIIENDLAIAVDGDNVVDGYNRTSEVHGLRLQSATVSDEMIFDQLNEDERRLSPSQVRELEG